MVFNSRFGHFDRKFAGGFLAHIPHLGGEMRAKTPTTLHFRLSLGAECKAFPKDRQPRWQVSAAQLQGLELCIPFARIVSFK